MRETITEVVTKQEVLKDFTKFYETSWMEGKLTVCNEEHVKGKAKHFLDSVSNAAERFHSIDFYRIVEDCVKGKKEQELNVLRGLVKAFEVLELICANLFLTPWRKEIRSLKTFTGHFVYFVQPVLSEDILRGILETIGYSLKTATEFRITGKIDEEKSKCIAFEMFLARMECEVILSVINDTKSCEFLNVLNTRSQIQLKHKDFSKNCKEEKDRSQKQDTAASHADDENTDASFYRDFNQASTSNKGTFSEEDSSNDRLKRHHETFELTSLLHTACENKDHHQTSKIQGMFPRIYHHSTSFDSVDLYNEYTDNTSGLNLCSEDSFQNEPQQVAKELSDTDQPTIYELVIKGAKLNVVFTDTEPTCENSTHQGKVNKESSHTLAGRLPNSMGGTYSDDETSPEKSKQFDIKALVMGKKVSSNTEERLNNENSDAESSSLYHKANETNEENIKYPVEETAYPTQVSKTPMDFLKADPSNLKYPGTSSALNCSAPKFCKPSQNLICSVPNCAECSSSNPPTTNLVSGSPLQDHLRYPNSTKCYKTTTIREPPNSIYIPPSSLDNHFPNIDHCSDNKLCLASQSDFMQNYFQPPSVIDSIVVTDDATFKIKEDTKEDFMVISKQKSD